MTPGTQVYASIVGVTIIRKKMKICYIQKIDRK